MTKQQAADTQQAAPAPFTTREAAEAFCAEFYQMLERLQTVIEQETEHLRAMNIAEAEALQKEKTELASVYIRTVSEFKAQTAAIRELVPEAIPYLSERHKKMRDSLLANEQTLETLRSVSSSLVRRAAERTAAKSSGPRTYSRSGTPPETGKAAAVAVNRRA